MANNIEEGGTAPSRGAFGALNDQPYVLLTLTMVFWSGNIVLARAVSEHIPPMALAQMRWTLAFLLLIPFAWRKVAEDWPTIRRHWKILTLLGILGMTIYNTLVYVGVQSTTAINATILSSLFPVVIALLGFLIYRDRLTVGQGVGLIVSSVGALVVISRGSLEVLAGFHFTPGDLWILGAQLAYAGYTVILRARPSIHPLSFLITTIFLGQLALWPFTIGEAALGAKVPWDLTTLVSVLYVSVFAAILAFLCFNRGVALIGSTRAGIFFHLIPVFGSLAAVLFLGEVIGLYHAIGWVLILTGIALAQRTRPSV
ncbi:MAG: DMT family transporter [Pseudomonadota bacterium]